MYALLAGLVAFIFVPFTWGSPASNAADLLIVAAVATFLTLKYRQLKEYSFDEKGVYRKRRLLFPWSKVRRLGLKFGKGGGSVTLVTPPTWGALLSGGVVQRETLVTYSASLVFDLEDGSVVTIPSNLDRLTGGRVVETLDELAKAANPRIEFV